MYSNHPEESTTLRFTRREEVTAGPDHGGGRYSFLAKIRAVHELAEAG
jgi:hypothetical protein